MNLGSKCVLERILYFMCHPEITEKEYMRRWEVSRRTYWRDKEFCQNRLFNYEVKIKEVK